MTSTDIAKYLALVPDDARFPSGNDLWSMVELCAQESYFELCEAFLYVWLDAYSHEMPKIQTEERLNSFFLKTLETADECDKWYVFRMMSRFGFEHLIDKRSLELELILSKECDSNSKQIVEITELSQMHMSNADEKSLATLRNLVLRKPKTSKLVIDLFNDSSSYNLIFTQCLIYAIKNNNKSLVFELLGILPDEEVNEKNQKLLEEVCDQFFHDEESQVLQLYSSVILRKTPKLLSTFISIIRGQKKHQIYDTEFQQFNFKESVLLASCEKKHFILELLEEEEISFLLPPNLRLLFLIYALYKNDLNLERFVKIESELENLIFRCKDIEVLSKSDSLFNGLIKRLKFIFSMTLWCINNSSNSINKAHLKFNIFQSLIRGELPLKILRKYDFLDNNYELNLEINEELCDLLSNYSGCELMIYRGFLAVRLSIMWIILEEQSDIDFSQKIKLLLNQIFPLTFRVEIMENIFSLLFVTQNEMTENNTDDEEETELSDDSDNSHSDTNNSSGTTPSVSFSESTHFLCPNSCVFSFLQILKDAAGEAQTCLFRLRNSREVQKNYDSPKDFNVPSSIQSLSECKTRLDNLLQYINEAEWRYSVIEPAFYKDLLKEKNKDFDSSSLENENEFELSQQNQPRILLSSGSTSDSEFGRTKESKEVFSSLICCMLASPNQLLRYSLLHGQMKSAEEVAKLFEKQLRKSEELIEMNIIYKWNELSNKLSSFGNAAIESKKSKTGNKTAIGSKTTQIQLLVEELMMKMECDDSRKKLIALDFALTACPSLEDSKIIMETVAPSQISLEFPEKINSFIFYIKQMVLNMSDETELKKLSLETLLNHLYEGQKLFCDIKSYYEEKSNQEQLCEVFRELKSQLVMLDPKKLVDDNDTISSPSSSSLRAEAKRVNILYEKLLKITSFEQFNYLKSLFYYVRRVSKALSECKKRSKVTTRNLNASYNDTSYFAILQQSPSAILCSMILKDKISPKYVDDLAKEMKVDLPTTLCSVLCPSISSYYLNGCPNEFKLNNACNPALCELIESHLSIEKAKNERPAVLFQISNHFESEETDSNRLVDEKINNPDLIEYFKSRNPILVELMKLMKLIKIEVKSVFEDNSPLIKWIEMVKLKINSSWVDETTLVALSLHPRILIDHSTIMKALEYHAVRNNLLAIYEIFKFIDDKNDFCSFDELSASYSSFSNHNSSLKNLKTSILVKLADEQENIKYALQIKNDSKSKCDIILKLIETAEVFKTADNAIKALKSCLSFISMELNKQQNAELTQKIKNKMNEIEFYVKIGQLTGLRSWKDAKDSLESIDILTIIKSKRKYPFAFEWFNIRGWETETLDLQFELLIHVFCSKQDSIKLDELLALGSNKQIDSLAIMLKVVPNIDNLESKYFLVKFILQKHSTRLSEDEIIYYNNFLKSIKLIEILPTCNQKHYLHLLSKPLLIIEQMLMNVEYEALEHAASSNKLPVIDNLIEIYAQKAAEIEIYDEIHHTTHGSTISDATMISSNVLEPPFVMPSIIPTRDEWVPDESSIICMSCRFERFSMLNRKHHCRRCGRVVCAACSQNTLVIPEIDSTSAVRVCDDCYNQTQQRRRKESSVSINSSSASTNSQNKTLMWILNEDEVHNQFLRSEFYYDSAPSVSLCLALLKFHSNKERSCYVIINLICKPLLETVASKQVDYGLVIGMIRSLLISTKISMEDEKSDVIDLINFYLGRLDVIRMLINANCNTKDMIGDVLSNNENAIIKLQEKLLEMERFELARDVAMKFGLGLKPIWKTWAFQCLRHGRFAEAREKFKQALKLYKNKERRNAIEEIINCLDNPKRQAASTSLRNQCLQIKHGKYGFYDTNDCQSFENSNFKLSSTVYKEILYYLETFGTKEDVIKFYAKHNLWKQAVEVFVNENPMNLTNIFVKELFMVAAEKGLLTPLLNSIRLVDPALTKTWKFLIATCKYLSRWLYFNVLYTLQVFMNDHLRAAMTQVNCFYLNPPAPDYNELYNRKEHLQLAKQHCQTFLSLGKNEHHLGYLIMEKSDVKKQIRLLDLQMDIVYRFFNNNVKGYLPFDIAAGDSKEKSRTLPTLLDHSRAKKTELAVIIILYYGQSIKEGFEVSKQIIRDYDLDSAQVYRFSARTLILSEKNDVIELLTELIQCIRDEIQDDRSSLCDDVVMAAIRWCPTQELIEPLIKLLSSDINKIDAYILSGKLKLAYLLAINLNRSVDVTRVLEAATRTNQDLVRKICQQWLDRRASNSFW